MRKIYTYLMIICLVAVTGCEKSSMSLNEEPGPLLTKSAEYKELEMIYCPTIQKWAVASLDPYDYSVFAHELKSTIGCETRQVPSPTHYALKVYPRSPEEQSIIESDNELKVSYIPFNYRAVSDRLAREYGSKRIEKATLKEQVKYQYNYLIEKEDGTTQTISQNMPVLYVVWPIAKEIPSDLDYSIEYKVILPDYYKGTEVYGVLKETENAIVARNSGQAPGTKASQSSRVFSGYLVNYDDLVDSCLAMPNLRVRFQLGSNIIDTYTDENGRYSINAPIGSTLSYVFEHTRWKITENNSTVPNSIVVGEASSTFVNNMTTTLSSIECPIHRALSYYFLSNCHPIVVPASNYMLQVKLTRSQENWGGVFVSPLFSAPYIQISDNRAYNTGSMFANVCHELGHYSHYFYKNNRLAYSSMHSMFKESFASYVSWVISYDYYRGTGATETSRWSFYLGQDYQNWTKYYTGDLGYYSPFFVDLLDDFNQYIENAPISGQNDLNYDSISGLPHSLIKSIATDNRIWSEIKSHLSSYIGVYFSQSDYNSFIAPYDYYFAHN